MTTQPLEEANMVHIRYAGTTRRVSADDLDLGELSSDDEVKAAVADHLQIEVTLLDTYVVERHERGNMTIRPEAIFG